MRFYHITDRYIEFLRSFDEKVALNKKETRPYVGVVLEIEGIKYYAPFTSPKANLHPDVISNLEMGYIFEEIIRRFSEAHNEDAGQHYTPKRSGCEYDYSRRLSLHRCFKSS